MRVAILGVSLGEVLKFYDSVMPIRVPCYNDMLAIIAELATAHPGQNLTIVDLGIGTGNLEEKMLSVREDMTIVGYDYSKEMLDYTSRKLGTFRSKLKLTQLDFITQKLPIMPKCDVVVSNLALHSLPDDARTEVFVSVFDMMKDDGVFILGDKFRSRSSVVNELFGKFSNKWRENVKKGWTNSEHRKYESVWKLQGNGEEYVDTVEGYYDILKAVGFKEMDCICRLFCYGILHITK